MGLQPLSNPEDANEPVHPRGRPLTVRDMLPGRGFSPVEFSPNLLQCMSPLLALRDNSDCCLELSLSGNSGHCHHVRDEGVAGSNPATPTSYTTWTLIYHNYLYLL